MRLYLDASSLVKRYVAEDGSDEVRGAMGQADAWFICRVGLVETARALGLAGGARASAAFDRERSALGVVEVDEALTTGAIRLSSAHDLRTLDALHLSAALVLPPDDLVLATWDRRLHRAAVEEGFALLPRELA